MTFKNSLKQKKVINDLKQTKQPQQQQNKNRYFILIHVEHSISMIWKCCKSERYTENQPVLLTVLLILSIGQSYTHVRTHKQMICWLPNDYQACFEPVLHLPLLLHNNWGSGSIKLAFKANHYSAPVLYESVQWGEQRVKHLNAWKYLYCILRTNSPADTV